MNWVSGASPFLYPMLSSLRAMIRSRPTLELLVFKTPTNSPMSPRRAVVMVATPSSDRAEPTPSLPESRRYWKGLVTLFLRIKVWWWRIRYPWTVDRLGHIRVHKEKNGAPR